MRLTSELREAGELLAATPERAGLLAWLERAQAFVARTAPYSDRLEALQGQQPVLPGKAGQPYQRAGMTSGLRRWP